MTKDEFQKSVLQEIKRELEKGDVPLERMRELASAALDLGQRYPSEIPNDAAVEVVNRFSELTAQTSQEIKKDASADDQERIDEIRRSMGLRS